MITMYNKTDRYLLCVSEDPNVSLRWVLHDFVRGKRLTSTSSISHPVWIDIYPANEPIAKIKDYWLKHWDFKYRGIGFSDPNELNDIPGHVLPYYLLFVIQGLLRQTDK